MICILGRPYAVPASAVALAVEVVLFAELDAPQEAVLFFIIALAESHTRYPACSPPRFVDRLRIFVRADGERCAEEIEAEARGGSGRIEQPEIKADFAPFPSFRLVLEAACRQDPELAVIRAEHYRHSDPAAEAPRVFEPGAVLADGPDVRVIEVAGNIQLLLKGFDDVRGARRAANVQQKFRLTGHLLA